jgi:TPR repeat protein
MKSDLYLHIAVELLYLQNEKSIRFLIKAINLNNNDAIALLGFYFEFGILGIPKCALRALNLYTRASQISFFACSRISFLKKFGRPGVNIDIPLGRLYKLKAEKDRERATSFITYASNRNLKEAQYCLALCIFNEIALKSDPDLAFFWCRKSALQGLSQAQNLLANFYIEGKGTPKNAELGMEFYLKASRQKESTSMYNIGTLFERGIGVNPSLQDAIEWYTEAARKESVMAHNILGVFNEEGIIHDSSLEKAYLHYSRAAFAGHPNAQYNLGRCYHSELGVEKDDKIAFYWYMKAARQSHELSLLTIAICYEYGIGIEKNLQTAIDYYILASELNSPLAKIRLLPIVSRDIQNAIDVFFPQKAETKTITTVPSEIKLYIISMLNIGTVLSSGELDSLFNIKCRKENKKNLQNMERIWVYTIANTCSCSTTDCTRIMHVVMSLKSLNYDHT